MSQESAAICTAHPKDLTSPAAGAAKHTVSWASSRLGVNKLVVFDTTDERMPWEREK